MLIRTLAPRLASFVPITLIVSVLVFVLVQLSPGDPAVAAAGGADATPEAIQAARERLGLDKPLPVQYLDWIAGLVRGDWGYSYLSDRPVLTLIGEHLPPTLFLALFAMMGAILFAVPAGALAAVKSGTMLDRAVIVLTTLGICLPSFVVGIYLIMIFAIELQLLPAGSYVPPTEDPLQFLTHMILPSAALGAAVAAEITRHMRATLRDELGKGYVMTARSKGVGEGRIVFRHTLKNAALPVVTVAGLQVSRILAGTVVVEAVFNIRGLGSLLINSVLQRDYPVMLGIVVIEVGLVLVVNLVVDLTYTYLNPKLRRA